MFSILMVLIISVYKDKLCNYCYCLVVFVIIFRFKIYCIRVVGNMWGFFVSDTNAEGKVLAGFSTVLREIGIVYIQAHSISKHKTCCIDSCFTSH